MPAKPCAKQPANGKYTYVAQFQFKPIILFLKGIHTDRILERYLHKNNKLSIRLAGLELLMEYINLVRTGKNQSSITCVSSVVHTDLLASRC